MVRRHWQQEPWSARQQITLYLHTARRERDRERGAGCGIPGYSTGALQVQETATTRAAKGEQRSSALDSDSGTMCEEGT